MRYSITVFILFMLASTVFAQLTPVKLHEWRHEGLLQNGNWNISADSTSVKQTVNDEPTFFVSPDTFENVTIRGNFFVDGSDDDYIGFVFGYLRPDGAEEYFDFYLLDWKGGTQAGAQEGFTLSKVKGYVNVGSGTNTSHPYWNHRDTTQTVLDSSYADNGWKRNEEYNFELIYESNRVRISIDTTLIFDVSGEFRPGRFGFYNYSQPGVNYREFRVNEAPVAVQDNIKTWEDSTLILNATQNDNDADGHDITITAVGEAVNGIVSFTEGDSLIYYTPAENFFGSDSFYYHISDGNGGIDSAKVIINIISVNDPPTRVAAIPDTALTRDSRNIFYRKLNAVFSDIDIYDVPLDSFNTNSTGIVTASLSGDSLYLSSTAVAGIDTIIVTAVDDSSAVVSDTFIVQVLDITALKEIITPQKFSLRQNYPNPFNPSTTIEFSLPKALKVQLKIFNMLGKEVKTIVAQKLNPGLHSYNWDAQQLASGIYYYRLVAGDFLQIKKMILLK